MEEVLDVPVGVFLYPKISSEQYLPREHLFSSSGGLEFSLAMDSEGAARIVSKRMNAIRAILIGLLMSKTIFRTIPLLSNPTHSGSDRLTDNVSHSFPCNLRIIFCSAPVVPPLGFEPRTCGLRVRCSNQLS